MGYHYAIIPTSRAPDHDIDPKRHAIHLGQQCLLGDFLLLVSLGTPILVLDPRCAIIGHLFRRGGSRVLNGAEIPRFATWEERENQLLGEFWGDYVLLQSPESDTGALAVTRDPSGGMPCFYGGQHDGRFITSDITFAVALGLYSKEIDWHHVRHGLTFPYLRTQRTGLAGIGELLPGCRLTMCEQETKVRQVWSPWPFVAPERRHADPREAASAIREAVTAAVHAWAEVDGKILLEISGGLDSSIVAACLGQAAVSVQACTLVTPVPGADERTYARTMTEHLGFDLWEEHIRFEDACFEFDTPPSSITPAVGILHYASNKAMETAGDRLDTASYFSGGGGDSVFSYLKGAAPAADAFKERGLAAGMTALRDLTTLHQCTWWKAARLTLRKLRSRPLTPWKADTSFLSRTGAMDAPEHHPWFDIPDHALPGDRERILELIGAQSFKDGVPRDARRPVRFPLLAQPVVEACLGVPTWMWIAEGQNRAVARAAFAQALPFEIVNRRSKGSYINYCGAVYLRQKSSMRDFLLAGQLRSRGYLDTLHLERFFSTELPARDLSFLRIFDLCMVENWVRHQA